MTGQLAAGKRLLRRLPPTFTYSQARDAGLPERTLYDLRSAGIITRIGRGLYRRADLALQADLDLVEIAIRAPRATLSLLTALARHDLTDEIPPAIDVALPRGEYRPAVTAAVKWHLFDPDTFNIGRTDLPLEGQLTIGMYSPERTIIDVMRLRHWEGTDLAYTALRRWSHRRESSPAGLLEMARHFPQAERALRQTLEVLL